MMKLETDMCWALLGFNAQRAQTRVEEGGGGGPQQQPVGRAWGGVGVCRVLNL